MNTSRTPDDPTPEQPPTATCCTGSDGATPCCAGTAQDA